MARGDYGGGAKHLVAWDSEGGAAGGASDGGRWEGPPEYTPPEAPPKGHASHSVMTQPLPRGHAPGRASSPAYLGQYGRAHAPRPETHSAEAYPPLPPRPTRSRDLPNPLNAPAPEKPHRPKALAKPQALLQSVAYRHLSVKTSQEHRRVTHMTTQPPKQVHPPIPITSVGEGCAETDSEGEPHAPPLTGLEGHTQDNDDTCMHDTSMPRPNTFTIKAIENVHALPASTITQVEVAHNIIEAQEKAWQTVHEQAAQAGDLEMLKAFPVHIEEGRPPQWRPISYPVLKDIKKAIVEHDLSSPYTLSLLESFFQAFDLTPNDIRQVTSAWLPTLQYSAFEAEWKALIRKHVKEGNFVPIPRDLSEDKAIDQMYGEGAYVTNTKQAMTPLPVLHKTTELVFEAIKKVAQTSTSTPSYALIFQGPKEPFYDFASWLKEAVAKQISDPKAQDVLFKSLVIEKANEECRKILQPLRNPTLLEMIEACHNVDYTKNDLELMACAVKGRCFNCEGEECTITVTPKQPLREGEEYLIQPAAEASHRGIIAQSGLVSSSVDDSFNTDKLTLSLRVLLPPVEVSSLDPVAVLLPTSQLQYQQQTAKVVNWTTTLTDDQPLLTVVVASPIGRVLIEGLLDTGVDVTIVTAKDWPDAWPKEETLLKDVDKFAFSVPTRNAGEPHKRFAWKVLPQGMKNSPTLCQIYVAKILSPIRLQNPTVIIYHYMDDILICAESKKDVIRVLNSVTATLQAFHFDIAPEKIQWDSPWHYLGWKLSHSSITPQKIKIDHDIKTLNDMQKLLGNINWIRPQLGITTDELSPLFDLLQGEPDLDSPRSLTKEAQESLQIVEHKISNMQAQRKLVGVPPVMVVLNGPKQPFAVLGQMEPERDEVVIWEWVFLPHCFPKTLVTFPELLSKVIIRARTRCWEMAGQDPHTLFVPITSENYDNMLILSTDFQLAVQDFKGQVQFSLPGKRIIQKLKFIPIELKIMRSQTPIPGAITVFTDGSGRTGKAVVTWKVGGEWCHDCHVTTGSSQVVELSTMVRAFTLFPNQPLNIVSDSAYVVGVVKRAEHSYLKKLHNKQLFTLFRTLITLINEREHTYFIVHIRSHSTLPGPVAEGNHQADILAGVSVVLNLLQQARASHEFLHQNAKSLQKQFHLTQNQAKEIIKSCPECQKVSPLQPMGANPRGLKPLQLWQRDVTHIPQFGQLKYIHVSIDTFSKLMVASAHTGEKARDVQRHLIAAFAYMGVPAQIKTDNGPAYTSVSMQAFFQQWGIQHTTGIPHNPTGQAIVERAHQTLKNMLKKQEKSTTSLTPQEKLAKVLYVLNFLNRQEGNLTL
ncbi:hypothetical protein WISP_78065 [Willisornis vidua]|uniref:Uncharacterized protein n=1 Tax=Willisornis vidua TaxID=1566151 RepID=A0ABQ9D5J8_9PASS|nr:hypothetical protein WISP_78065 [Willisornis vidua]